MHKIAGTNAGDLVYVLSCLSTQNAAGRDFTLHT